ncbi:MAG TPA: LysR family transcriptional regulator [Alphaproteobacteria bacterium]
MDWDKLRVFHVVAESGSFTHAGELLELSQSAVSRQIRALEDSLHVALFHRHARGLIATEQGELLHRITREVFAKVSYAEAMLTESTDRPRGPLRITTTVGFGSMWLTGHVGEFLDNYPEITVSLVVTDAELDLTMRQADVAIRMAPPRQPDLIQRHLFTGRFGVFAIPDYLNRFGTPRTIEDLVEHRVITFGEQVSKPFEDINWLADKVRAFKPDFQPAFTVNNVYGSLRAVETGIGIAGLPAFLARQNPRLVRVLPEIESPKVDAYFVYPEQLRQSRRVVVFRDFLLRKVAETPF